MNKENVPTIQFVGVDPWEYLKQIALAGKNEVKKAIVELKSEKQERYLSVEQTAEFLQVSKNTVYCWSRGENRILIPRKIGNKTRYKKSDIEAVLNRDDSVKKKS